MYSPVKVAQCHSGASSPVACRKAVTALMTTVALLALGQGPNTTSSGNDLVCNPLVEEINFCVYVRMLGRYKI